MSQKSRAFARRTDPDTSHAAADRASVTLNENRQAVLDVLRNQGEPVTDVELVAIYGASAEFGRVPLQAQSGIRTRRCELVRAGLVVRAGTRRYGRGRGHSEWRVAA